MLWAFRKRETLIFDLAIGEFMKHLYLEKEVAINNHYAKFPTSKKRRLRQRS